MQTPRSPGAGVYRAPQVEHPTTDSGLFMLPMVPEGRPRIAASGGGGPALAPTIGFACGRFDLWKSARRVFEATALGARRDASSAPRVRRDFGRVDVRSSHPLASPALHGGRRCTSRLSWAASAAACGIIRFRTSLTPLTSPSPLSLARETPYVSSGEVEGVGKASDPFAARLRFARNVNPG